MRELRCSKEDCNRMLGMSHMEPGSKLQIKCPRCKTVTEFRSYQTITQATQDDNQILS